ncbi:MAG TPA: glycosyltransferase [Puia sp.]|nr:glycosyltransferase [Puia sp.]
MKILATTYAHPDFLPPTINAIREMSKSFDRVIVISRNLSDAKVDFDKNVIQKVSGRYQHVRDSELAPLHKKVQSFFQYVSLLRRSINLYKPEVVVVYDAVPLFAYWLVLKLISCKPLLWYHNHDTTDFSQLRKYSISWWAAKYENKILAESVNIFSLPSVERKAFFQMDKFKGEFFFLPNFPSISFYGPFYEPKKLGDSAIKIIFQGSIGEGHGLENIASLLNSKIEGRPIELVIKGWIRDENFKTKMVSIAESVGSADKLHFVPYGPYKDLPLTTRECHIGIGIHSLTNDLHTTLAKASNKLYEYAALGLPIIVYDSEHYRDHLKKFDWVFFSSDDPESLSKSIRLIVINYDELSRHAHESFMKELNFEYHFNAVVKYLHATQKK